MDINKIKERIKWLEKEISGSNHFDGYVLKGLLTELEEQRNKLKEIEEDEQNRPWNLRK